MKPGKIILTDWPKSKWIEANYRGVETEELLRKHKDMFHTMMGDTVEVSGGYVIRFDSDKVRKELKFRGEKVIE